MPGPSNEQVLVGASARHRATYYGNNVCNARSVVAAGGTCQKKQKKKEETHRDVSSLLLAFAEHASIVLTSSNGYQQSSASSRGVKSHVVLSLLNRHLSLSFKTTREISNQNKRSVIHL